MPSREHSTATNQPIAKRDEAERSSCRRQLPVIQPTSATHAKISPSRMSNTCCETRDGIAICVERGLSYSVCDHDIGQIASCAVTQALRLACQTRTNHQQQRASEK